MRSLLYDLGVTYNELAALEAKGDLFSSVMASYDRLMAATREQLRVGAISLSEALRLESEYKAVKAQALENANQKEQALSHLRISLQYPADTVVQLEQNIPPFAPSLQMDTLIRQALDVRPDLKVTSLYRTYQERNIRLQQSSGIPDIKIGFQPIDFASNYIRNYSGLNLEFPLPIFDRNQGRIQEAKVGLLQSQFEVQLKQSVIQNEVVAAYRRYQQTNEGVITYTPEFLQQIRTLNQSVNQNFQRRTISLLEFIDQQRIYISTNLQLIDLRQQYLNSVNDLNFSVGTQVIEN
jgi:cobalt-zinc-cadmium efflux system outer membrane protein